jgi:hypothetical protein
MPQVTEHQVKNPLLILTIHPMRFVSQTVVPKMQNCPLDEREAFRHHFKHQRCAEVAQYTKQKRKVVKVEGMFEKQELYIIQTTI